MNRETRARHAVLSNRSRSLPNIASAGAKVAPYAANPNQHRCRCRCTAAIKRRRTAQRHCREMTGSPLRLERYCPQFPGAKGAPRSCPAGSIAVAGLRWCGGRPQCEARVSVVTFRLPASPSSSFFSSLPWFASFSFDDPTAGLSSSFAGRCLGPWAFAPFPPRTMPRDVCRRNEEIQIISIYP
jgi:hypothetical protein